MVQEAVTREQREREQRESIQRAAEAEITRYQQSLAEERAKYAKREEELTTAAQNQIVLTQAAIVQDAQDRQKEAMLQLEADLKAQFEAEQKAKADQFQEELQRKL